MTKEQAKEEILRRFPQDSGGLSLYPLYAYPDDDTPAWIGLSDGQAFLVDDMALEHYHLSSITPLRR